MKKIVLGLLAIASTSIATAQINLDFETWIAGPGYDDPDGWFTVNQYSGFGAPITVVKETVAPGGGTASVAMTTTYCGICSLAGISDTLPGFVRQQVAHTATSITSVDFKYLYNSVAGDEAFALVALTKWNGTSADTVAVAALNLTDQPTWTTSNMLMFYVSPAIPDTLTLMFGSSIAVATGDYSYPQSQFGSELKIDDIVLNGAPLKVEESPLSSEIVDVYTSDNSIVINMQEFSKNTRIEVYNITGELISQKQLISTKEIISTDDFSSGLYLVKVSSTQGETTKKVYVK